MKLTWLGAAGFVLETRDGIRILLDPFVSRPSNARPPPHPPLDLSKSADGIFLTHGHFDHAADSPSLSHQTGAPIFASRQVVRSLINKGADPARLEILHAGQTIQIGSVRIKTLPARHVRFNPGLVLKTIGRCGRRIVPFLREAARWPAGKVLAFEIQADGLRLVHFGSADFTGQTLRDLRAPDIALVPVQGRCDIAVVAARLCARLNPGLIIPHHWDDFSPPLSQLVELKQFWVEVRNLLPKTRIFTPKLGVPFEPASLPGSVPS